MSEFEEKNGFFYLKTRVMSFQLDKNKQISPVAIAELMQEAAGMHSNTGGFGYKQVIDKSLVWVLNALKFEVNKFPLWDDEITIKTWIVESNRFLSRRDFKFIDSKGNTIVKGSSIWILYNFKTKRPQSINTMNFNVKVHNDVFAVERAIITSREKLQGDVIDTYNVKYSDLDMVGHLNNTRYIKAIIDSYEMSHFDKSTLASFEIQFRAEAKYGNELLILRNDTDNNYHKVDVQIANNKSICFALLEWK